MTQRSTFVLDIHPDHVDEYVRAHADVWPEMLEAIKNAGIRNYTIFRRDNQMFGYFETDDVAAADEYLSRQDVSERWREAMSPLLAEVPVFDGVPRLPPPLTEVFRLD